MPWLKQDDGMGEHRKTRRLLRRGKSGSGLMAFGLHELALLHSSKYLTDGHVDREFVEDTLDDAKVTGKLRADLVAQLVAAGQWEEVDDGWIAHGYLDHNPSRREVETKREADREAKSIAGRKGAEARWGRKPEGGSDSSVPSPGHTTDNSAAIDGDSPVPSRPAPVPNPSVVLQEEEARVTKASGSRSTHPQFQEVMDILAAAKGLVVEPASVDNALRARPDGNALEAAYTVVSWSHEPGGTRTPHANRLLKSAFELQATEAARRAAAVERSGGPRRDGSTSSVTRRSSAADEIARREKAAEAQLAREAAEAEGRAAA